jgi:cbb3-type cytochrome oxidase subunit 3
MTEAEQRATTLAGAAADTANRLITALPVQFLVLVLMNTVFIAGLLYFLNRENEARQQTEQHLAEARERVLLPLLTACIQHKGD